MIIAIIGAIALMVCAGLYVKGKEDAETFDGELRYLIACIRLFPVTDVAFETINKQFDKINKLPGRDKKQVSVAFVEFAYKFKELFPALGDEANLRNVE